MARRRNLPRLQHVRCCSMTSLCPPSSGGLPGPLTVRLAPASDQGNACMRVSTRGYAHGIHVFAPATSLRLRLWRKHNFLWQCMHQFEGTHVQRIALEAGTSIACQRAAAMESIAVVDADCIWHCWASSGHAVRELQGRCWSCRQAPTSAAGLLPRYTALMST